MLPAAVHRLRPSGARGCGGGRGCCGVHRVRLPCRVQVRQLRPLLRVTQRCSIAFIMLSVAMLKYFVSHRGLVIFNCCLNSAWFDSGTAIARTAVQSCTVRANTNMHQCAAYRVLRNGRPPGVPSDRFVGLAAGDCAGKCGTTGLLSSCACFRRSSRTSVSSARSCPTRSQVRR